MIAASLANRGSAGELVTSILERQVIEPAEDPRLSVGKCQFLHGSCPRSIQFLHQPGRSDDQAALPPIRPLRRGRLDLRIDLDALPRFVRWAQCICPDHRAGDFPRWDVTGSIWNQPLVGAAEGAALWLRGGGVWSRDLGDALPRRLPGGNRLGLPEPLSLAGRLARADDRQMGDRRESHPATVRVTGDDVSPDDRRHPTAP